MNIKNLLNLNAGELSAMSTNQLRGIANALASASNKRIRRIEESGYGYASYSVSQRRTKSGSVRKFSTKIKKVEIKRELRKQTKKDVDRAKRRVYLSKIAQMKTFLTSPSSTLPGAKSSAERIAQDLGIDDYERLSRAQQNKFWKAYNMLKQRYPDLLRSNQERYQSRRQELFDIMVKSTRTGKLRVTDPEKAIQAMFERLDTEYAIKQRTSPDASPLRSIQVKDEELSTDTVLVTNEKTKIL